jgi:hypothetical protein
MNELIIKIILITIKKNRSLDSYNNDNNNKILNNVNNNNNNDNNNK